MPMQFFSAKSQGIRDHLVTYSLAVQEAYIVQKMLQFTMLPYYLSMLGSTGQALEQLIILCRSFTGPKKDLVVFLALGPRWLVGSFTEHHRKQLLWYVVYCLFCSYNSKYYICIYCCFMPPKQLLFKIRLGFFLVNFRDNCLIFFASQINFIAWLIHKFPSCNY